MTITQILTRLSDCGKPCSQPQLYRYFGAFKIKPSGIRQRPQHYPPDTADRILAHLGVSKVDARRLPSVPLPEWVKGAKGQKAFIKRLPSVPLPEWVKELNAQKPVKKLITVAQLRAAKPKTKGTK